MSDTITVLRAHGRRLAKVIHVDGGIDDYDKARTVDIFEIHVDGLGAVEHLLRRLARRPGCCAVRGAIVDPQRVKNVRRLLYRDRTDKPTLREVPRRWLALDFDSLLRPDWIEPTDLAGCACVAIETLPAEFRRVGFIVQATAGHGLKPGIRIRLWCWLGRPVSTSELKYWLRSAPVDKSVFGAAQVIYTAAPIFLPEDPEFALRWQDAKNPRPGATNAPVFLAVMTGRGRSGASRIQTNEIEKFEAARLPTNTTGALPLEPALK